MRKSQHFPVNESTSLGEFGADMVVVGSGGERSRDCRD